MSHSASFEEFEDFFLEFYNCGLYFVQYASNNRLGTSEINFAKHFNEYLDNIRNWTYPNLNVFNSKLIPYTEYFRIGINENYVAYKLLNLMFFKKELTNSDFHIQEYTNHEDKNIEKLLFENQKIMPFILSVHTRYNYGKGLNFGVFSNLKIEKKFFEELADKFPEFQFHQKLKYLIY